MQEQAESGAAAQGGPSPTDAAEARALAEAGLHAQAQGRPAEADELLSQAQGLDPDTVADVLREHDAGRAPDARLQRQTDRDVENPLSGATLDPAVPAETPSGETIDTGAPRAS